MERSLKHMLVISKKYFRALSPSVCGPYILGIQSGKLEVHLMSSLLFLMFLPCFASLCFGSALVRHCFYLFIFRNNGRL